jgi:protein-disulfide isomerase
MTDSTGSRSALPWIFILLTAVVCMIVGLSIAGIGIVYYLGRTVSSSREASFPAREMGPQNAPVVVEEFGDYQCPFCALDISTAEIRLRDQYIQTGKVRFIFRNFPIVDTFVANGTESHLAALAALCAGDQNMFWEYHDLLFASQVAENSGYFSTPRLQAMAARPHLDGVRFDQCLSPQTHKNILDADIRSA